MTEPLQQLHTDHINASRLLNIMQQQLLRLAEGETTDIGLMVDIMVYMTQYPDLYHHPKEDLIYEQWQKRDTSVTPLVDELTVEHRSIVRSGIHLLELLRSVGIDGATNQAEILDAGHHYLSRMWQHMDREEAQLFPRIEDALTADDWQSLEEQMSAPDDPLFGRSVSTQFRQRYNKIMQLIEKQ